MRLIFNLLAAIVIAVSFAPVAFAGTSDEELMQQYDELVDKWVSDGLNGGAIAVQTRIFLYNHGLVKSLRINKKQDGLTENHPELQDHMKQKFSQIPAELQKRDMKDELLIRQYDEIFDTLTSTGEDKQKFTNGWLTLISLFGVTNKNAHSDLLKHIEQKLKK